MEIDVSYEPAKTAPSMTMVDVAGWAIMLGIGLLLAYLVLKDTPGRGRSQRPSALATSNSAAPSTPDRSTLTVTNDKSPRTPQPFVDYVRRTIDETPYYRREGRRRINPQNTF